MPIRELNKFNQLCCPTKRLCRAARNILPTDGARIEVTLCPYAPACSHFNRVVSPRHAGIGHAEPLHGAKKAYCPRCFYRPRYKIDDFFCDITKIDEDEAWIRDHFGEMARGAVEETLPSAHRRR